MRNEPVEGQLDPRPQDTHLSNVVTQACFLAVLALVFLFVGYAMAQGGCACGEVTCAD